MKKPRFSTASPILSHWAASLIAGALALVASSAQSPPQSQANLPARDAAQIGGSPSAGSARPNVLLAISDDQSFAHTSATGCRAVRTPAFDRVASEGVLFRNAFGASPGCSPCRASLLTGRHTWQIEQAGTHASSFPTDYVVYPDLLEQAGYWIGCTGKGWGPGDWAVSGRTRNPAGPAFNQRTASPPHRGMVGAGTPFLVALQQLDLPPARSAHAAVPLHPQFQAGPLAGRRPARAQGRRQPRPHARRVP